MMTSKNISFSLAEYKSVEELNNEDRDLVFAAKQAAGTAYAPYSKFKVGAAVRLENGVIVKGSNVENAAFPSGICAERNALSTTASNYPGLKPVAIAVAAFTEDGITKEPVSPCGNCRQVIAEEEFRNNSNIRVILYGEDKIQIVEKGGDLLPLQFSRNYLKLNSR
jgi:cytidine deaminase